MQSSYIAATKAPSARASWLHLSPDLATVILFSLIGLTISATVLTSFAADDLGWLLANFG